MFGLDTSDIIAICALIFTALSWLIQYNQSKTIEEQVEESQLRRDEVLALTSQAETAVLHSEAATRTADATEIQAANLAQAVAAMNLLIRDRTEISEVERMRLEHDMKVRVNSIAPHLRVISSSSSHSRPSQPGMGYEILNEGGKLRKLSITFDSDELTPTLAQHEVREGARARLHIAVAVPQSSQDANKNFDNAWRRFTSSQYNGRMTYEDADKNTYEAKVQLHLGGLIVGEAALIKNA